MVEKKAEELQRGTTRKQNVHMKSSDVVETFSDSKSVMQYGVILSHGTAQCQYCPG